MSTARFDVGREMLSARDLGSNELWERSLTRSRQRRRLAEVGRRARRKRKSASLALSAALAAAPVLPELSTAIAAGSGSAVSGSVDTGAHGLLDASASPVVVHVGSEGGLVAAAQRRLNEVLPLTYVRVDGIFGPITRAAVLDFQRRHGLSVTGSIDARTWALLFDAPVLLLSQNDAPATAGPAASAANYSSAAAPRSSSGLAMGARSDVHAASALDGTGRAVEVSGTAGTASAVVGATAPAPASTPGAASGAAAGPSSQGGGSRTGHDRTSGTRQAGTPGADQGVGNKGANHPHSGSVAAAPAGSARTPRIGVVAPPRPSSQPSTYVLADGVALPLPRGYIVNGYVDQGVDYSAPGGTPLYAMGDGVIIGEGISGFGPNAPILQITSGPLKGLEVYYGHSGPDSAQIGQHVRAGQQISEVGYGIVGISTGPHLEIGVYPPGPNGAGSRMLGIINSLLNVHPTGRAWGATATAARVSSSSPSSAAAPALVRGPRIQATATVTKAVSSSTTSAGGAVAGGLKTPPQAASARTDSAVSAALPGASTPTAASTAPATQPSAPAPAAAVASPAPAGPAPSAAPAAAPAAPAPAAPAPAASAAPAATAPAPPAPGDAPDQSAPAVPAPAPDQSAAAAAAPPAPAASAAPAQSAGPDQSASATAAQSAPEASAAPTQSASSDQSAPAAATQSAPAASAAPAQ